MLDREVRLTRQGSEKAANIPAAGEARVDCQRTVYQPDHGAKVLAEVSQHQGGVDEDGLVVLRRLERLPSETDGVATGCVRVFGPAVLDEPEMADRPGKRRTVMPIDGDRLIEQSQSLGNPVFGYRIEHCKRSEVEIVGAETEFADLRAAWDALPEARQRELDGARRRAQHLPLAQPDRLCRFQRRHLQAIAAGAAGLGPPPPLFGPHQSLSRLARVAHHRLAGRGGRALIEELIAFATGPQFVYRHRWTVGDIVMWDNRCTMHRGRPYDDTQRRVLHRTTVSDVANTLEQEGLAVPAAA